MSTLNDNWRQQTKSLPRTEARSAGSRVANGSAKRREDVRSIYRRWWLGKMVRPTIENTAPFRLVTKVEWFGPPSGVYGCVQLTFQDGTNRMVPTMSYRPRKTDIEVLPNVCVSDAERKASDVR
jgi:hypothetical protein